MSHNRIWCIDPACLKLKAEDDFGTCLNLKSWKWFLYVSINPSALLNRNRIWISKYFKLLLNSIKWCGLNEEYPSHTKNFEWVQRSLKTDDDCEDEFLSMYNVWVIHWACIYGMSTYYKYFSSMILYFWHNKFKLVVPERLSQLKASMHVKLMLDGNLRGKKFIV